MDFSVQVSDSIRTISDCLRSPIHSWYPPKSRNKENMDPAQQIPPNRDRKNSQKNLLTAETWAGEVSRVMSTWGWYVTRVISVKTWSMNETSLLRSQSQDVIDFPQSSITSIQSQDLKCPKFQSPKDKRFGEPKPDPGGRRTHAGWTLEGAQSNLWVGNGGLGPTGSNRWKTS